MRNRILFINPPLSADKRLSFLNQQFPLGFLYMAGILKKEGFEVKILDCPLYYNLRRKIDDKTVKIGLFPEQIKKIIQEFKPDIIGVNCSYTMFESDSFEVIDLIKQVNSKILVVVGGAHVSSNPEFVLRNRKIDLAVIGEGELTILDIAKRLKNNKNLNDIKGTALILKDKFKINAPREQIQDLDSLEPDWSLVNFKEYFAHPDNSNVIMRKPSVNIVTSRGCPGNCIFCSVHTVWGRKWRAISSKKVVDEIEFLVKNYHVRHFRINDDNLTLDKKRIIDICKEIKKRKLDIKWDTPSGVAFWTLDKEVLKEMKEAGCYRITFGIESGCKKTIKYIRKAIDLKRVSELVGYCHEIGLWVASFFIIGFPNETKKDIEETKKYIINSNLNFPFIFIAQPYPGTDLYEDFKKEGLLDKGFADTSTFIQSKYHSKYLSPQELNKIRKDIYIQFYLRKSLKYLNPFIFYREILSKIKTFEELAYTFKIIKSLITNFAY